MEVFTLECFRTWSSIKNVRNTLPKNDHVQPKSLVTPMAGINLKTYIFVGGGRRNKFGRLNGMMNKYAGSHNMKRDHEESFDFSFV